MQVGRGAYKLVELFAEIGGSGTNLRRVPIPKLKEILLQIDKNIQKLLLYMSTRVSRNSMHWDLLESLRWHQEKKTQIEYLIRTNQERKETENRKKKIKNQNTKTFEEIYGNNRRYKNHMNQRYFGNLVIENPDHANKHVAIANRGYIDYRQW